MSQEANDENNYRFGLGVNPSARLGIEIPLGYYNQPKVVTPCSDGSFVGSASPVQNKNVVGFVQKSPTLNIRLNKFVRRLHEMLTLEREGGVVEWRRGLLVLHSIDTFTKILLPKYFNTRNFKTFRRQLNYYGFVHLRSFSTAGSAITALWVNQELADHGSDSISSVLKLKRVEPSEASKTPEGRRERKNEAASSVEVEGIVGNGSLYANPEEAKESSTTFADSPPIPMVVHCHVTTTDPAMQPSVNIGNNKFVNISSNHDENSALLSCQIGQMPTVHEAAGLLLCLSHATRLH